MLKLRHSSLLFVILMAALLSGCKMVIFNPEGLIALKEEHLLLFSIGLTLIIVIPVLFLAIFIPRRYRASNNTAKYTPEWSHSNILEAVWWLVPCIIIGILAVVTWISTHNLSPYRKINEKNLGIHTDPLSIQVIALRWKWLFIYPKQNIATVNYIEFPVNTPISFHITADAPMNSFQIPALGGQIYAMNAMPTQLHLIAEKEGVYNGRSVSFSGEGFANMTFKAHVTSNAQFQKWVTQVKHAKKSLTMAEYSKLVQPTISAPVEYFSSATNNLFEKVIQSFLTPPTHEKITKMAGVQL